MSSLSDRYRIQICICIPNSVHTIFFCGQSCQFFIYFLFLSLFFSIHEVSVGTLIHQSSVLKYSKINICHPFEMHLVFELNEHYYDSGLEFFEIIMIPHNKIVFFLSRIVFSNEAIFFLNGMVNRQNFDIGLLRIHIGEWRGSYPLACGLEWLRPQHSSHFFNESKNP